MRDRTGENLSSMDGSTALTQDERHLVAQWEGWLASPILELIYRLDTALVQAQREIDRLAPTVLALEDVTCEITRQRDRLRSAVEKVVDHYERNDDPKDWPLFANICQDALGRLL